ncbi:MAG: VWA domain-containing protein, partial [Gammaproteobacteria bacterium]|nr:VWA domain-containing protein [Gammaproteobacteria bacterium]
LQPGTRAGVWTFARWTDDLVPVTDVDAAWKQRIQSISEQITSPGQFTNIEEVLDKSSADWEGTPTTHARHLVLLTDGMVDVSKEPGASEASRARILDTLLPRLQARGVKVHTIALSARADHDLMKRLAEQTGGWYQQVAQADELQRVFLRMFEQVGSPDSVPLTDNRFTVDSSINEATVLLFTKPDSPPVVLRSPSGEEFTDSDVPGGVAWFQDEGYHLITISAPRKGEWSVVADVDPDNRVMIVTDLKLRTSEIPSHVAVGEQTHVEAHLTNRGKLVTRQAFLRLLDVRADAIGPNGRDPQPINDAGDAGDKTAEDGRYSLNFAEQRALEQVELLISVDSPTFMREKRFRLVVHEPVSAEAIEGPDGPELLAELQTAVLQPGAELSAWQQDAAGNRIPLSLDEYRPGQYRAVLDDTVSPAFVEVSATTRLGNLLQKTYGPLALPGVESPPPPPPAVPVEPAAPVETQSAEQTVAEPPAAPEPVPDPPEVEEEGGWLMPVLLFGGFNLLLAAGGGAWWFLHRRRKSQGDDMEIEDLIDDVDAPGEPTDVEDAA